MPGPGAPSCGRAGRLLLAALLVLPLLGAGCSINVPDLGRSLGGRTLPAGQAHPELWAEPDRWVLIENPRYEEGDAAAVARSSPARCPGPLRLRRGAEVPPARRRP